MKRYRLVWSARAASDLRSIRAFIAFDKPAAAISFVKRVRKAVERLRRFPASGRVVAELSRTDRRELIVDGYRVIYKFEGGTVAVLTVFEGHKRLEF